ncbi:MAG: hypothetical protein IKB92_01835 [Clostridia bacterium]|nr:hypothetical protein [Clostridia bacterium]
MNIAEKLTTVAKNEQKVYDAGYKKHYDFFWDGMLNYGNPANYINRFRRWTNTEIYQPNHNIVHSLSAPASATETFRESFFTDLKVDNIFNDVSRLNYFCQDCTTLVNARTFHVIEKTTYYSPFGNCPKLVEIRFNGTIGQNGISFSSCVKLSKDSIESVIGHLSSAASGLTVTFSKTAVNKAFEMSSGANDGAASGEWLALVASKSNWTIALA